MSLKLLKIENTVLAHTLLVAVACLCLYLGWTFVRWNFANAIASHLDTRLAESKLIAEWLAEISPTDPATHYAFAVALEKSFEPADIERSLTEYRRAAELSPNHFSTWLALARASSRSGDTDTASLAFGRALELAPNYSHVHWAYGNFLVRQNRLDEGFDLISKAVKSNRDYSGPAAVLAMQIFDNDVERVRYLLGGDENADAALAPALASLKRYDDAMNAWSRLPNELKSTKYRLLGEQLIEQMVGGKRFRYAARLAADLAESDISKPVIGQIQNGGFEHGVKIKNAGHFEWQIEEGTEPQIGLSETTKHSGKYGLWFLFNTFETARFRQVSQVVAVEPGGYYRFEAYYVSALKASSKLKFAIVNPATGAILATTAEMTPTNVWSLLAVEFVIPDDVDGVKIQLLREGCNGPACPVNGTLGFDDISLRLMKK